MFHIIEKREPGDKWKVVETSQDQIEALVIGHGFARMIAHHHHDTKEPESFWTPMGERYLDKLGCGTYICDDNQLLRCLRSLNGQHNEHRRFYEQQNDQLQAA